MSQGLFSRQGSLANGLKFSKQNGLANGLHEKNNLYPHDFNAQEHGTLIGWWKDKGHWNDAGRTIPCSKGTDTIAVWDDQSGLGRNWIGGGGANSPLFIPQGQGALPVVGMGGRYMTCTVSFTPPITMFFAIWNDGIATASPLMLMDGEANDVFYHRFIGLPGKPILQSVAGQMFIADSGWAVWSFVYGTPNGNIRISIANVRYTNNANTARTALTLGARGASFDRRGTWKIGEILIYQGDVSQYEAIIRRYLYQKWNVKNR